MQIKHKITKENHHATVFTVAIDQFAAASAAVTVRIGRSNGSISTNEWQRFEWQFVSQSEFEQRFLDAIACVRRSNLRVGHCEWPRHSNERLQQRAHSENENRR